MRERARQLSLVSTHSLSARKRETPSKKCSPKRALSRRPFPSRESNSTASMSQAAVRGFSRGREASVETQRRERGQRRIIVLASTAAIFFFFFFFFFSTSTSTSNNNNKNSRLNNKKITDSTLPSEALAALKTSIGAFLTEYMKQNAIAVEGQDGPFFVFI